MMTTNRPHRHIEVQINVSADNVQSVISSLLSIANHLDTYEENGQPITLAETTRMGSYSVTGNIDTTVNHDSYQAALKTYIAELAHREPPETIKVCHCKSGFQGDEWECAVCGGGHF